MNASQDIKVAQLDPLQFRRALGNFATGVTIVTAQNAQGEKVGVTANSFNSVSLDPALILWSIDKRSTSFPVFEQASHFVVNILSGAQIELSNRFARKNIDKFEGTQFHHGAGFAPVLDNCSAVFECERHQVLEGGDHWIIVGKVVNFTDEGRSPLLYHQGAYSSVMPHPSLGLALEACTDSAKKEQLFQTRLYRNAGFLMSRAMQGYLKRYAPKQMTSGLRTSEARLLMVLAGETATSKEELLRDVAVPMLEIDRATEILENMNLLENHEDFFALTEKGKEAAEQLFDIADGHQTEVFKKYSDQEKEAFFTILRDLIGFNA
ncbi:p-hydroxyphenylacetate 3-hydroxylase reductase component [Acinetobacter sp. MB5]|uniref:p-hydroxyphenylacetate 3-hydroxylase reductase component n=1 Tax=Acinetobacter sp. MB5 TaxID=2069438 RepID=UPI000DCFAE95|nr:flavin reductase [Acinetobacter sp. MB5]